MKRFFRISARFVLVLLMLLLALWLLIQAPFFQNWLAKNAAKRLSKGLKTTVRVDNVSFRLFNTVNLEGLYVADRHNDTLLTAGLMQVNITDWFFAKDSADLKYIKLVNVNANLYRNDSIWNYQFLIDYFGSGSKKKDTAATGIALHLKVVDLENVHLRRSDRWRGRFLVAGVEKLHLEANQISFKKSIFDIASLELTKPEYRELKKSGLWSAADSIAFWNPKTLAALADTTPKEINPKGTLFLIRSLTLKDGTLEFYNRQKVPSEKGLFDSRDILVNGITGTFKDVSLVEDTMMAKVDLKANERSGVELKRLKTSLRVDPHIIELADLDLQINNSRLGDYYAMHFENLEAMDRFIDSVRIVARIKNSTVDMQDIGFFAPLLKTKKQVVQLTGNATGTVSNFFIKNLDLRAGQSRLTGDYSMVGLTDIEKTIINFETDGSQLALNDVAVWSPQLLDLKNTPVGNLGTVTYRGSYAGTIYNFMAKGSIQTDVGSMEADFKMNMEGAAKGYSGIISNARFNAGKLLNVKDLGDVHFNGTISSNGFGVTNPLKIKGTILQGQYAGYNYRNIVAEGIYNQNKLTAALSLDDENIAGNFETVLDFNANSRRYNGRGIVRTADLRALGFMKDSLRFSGEFDVDFKGKTIDDFLGYARFYNGKIVAGANPLSFDSLLLQSEIDSAGVKRLSLHTNEADVSIEGKFNISNLGNGFQYFFSRYYPAFIKPPKTLVANQDLFFNISTRQIEPFLGFIDKKLHGLNDAKLSGSLNTNKRELLINADIPFFAYDKLRFTNATVNGSGDANSLNVMGSIFNLAVNDSINFPNAVIRLNTNQDTTHFVVNTSTTGPLGEAQIDAVVYSKPKGFQAFFNESSFIINNKKWTINSNGNIALDNGYLTSTGLTLQQNDQSIHMYTRPSGEGNWNDIHLDIKNLITGDFLPYLLKEPRMEGLASGAVIITDPTGALQVNADVSLEQFRFNDDSVGTVKINAEYLNSTKKLTAQIESPNKEYDFSGKVNVDLSDTSGGTINTVLPIRNMRINVLEKYLTAVFDQLDGYATGDIHIVGKLKSPSLVGTVKMRDGLFKVAYTKCVYKVDSAVLQLGDNYIDFGTMQLKDEANRKGEVEGRFYHRFFDSLSFNLKMRTDGMQVLNTSGKDNELFFGKAIARATFDLTGPLNNMNIRMSATPTDSSHIYISNKTTRETGNADFVVFKTYGTEMQAQVDPEKTNFHMDIDLNANPLCKVDVILDEVTGDIIKAVGNGNLKIHTGTLDETTMRGRYVIQTGSYNYSFQTLIRKPFTLSAEDDNYIEWTGDPVNANLNINARYLARKVSMSTLVGSSGNNSVLDNSARNAQGDVYVLARIKGPLSAPVIDFDIELANNSTLNSNLSAKDLITRINNDASEKLRQVTYLIVFKSFAPYKEGTSIRNPGTDLAVNTISDIVSREMGKILTSVVQQITGDQSLNIDFSTNFYNSADLINGTGSNVQYDRVNVGVKLNKAYFNNRVVVNVGSDFDLSVRNTATTGFQFLPDISVEFILTSNRRLRAILFKRDDLDISGRRNRAGASLSYRKDFEKLIGREEEDVLFIIGREDKD
ncbi:MAG: translocation/assembly module TamB domain-containing protein [Bacteroidota bacterium]